jgi:hypothetical protein
MEGSDEQVLVKGQELDFMVIISLLLTGRMARCRSSSAPVVAYSLEPARGTSALGKSAAIADMGAEGSAPPSRMGVYMVRFRAPAKEQRFSFACR